VSRSCNVPVIRSTTLSIMYAYLQEYKDQVKSTYHELNSRHVIEERAERLDSIRAHIVKLLNEQLSRLVGNDRGRERQRLVREEVAIVRRRQLHPEVCTRSQPAISSAQYACGQKRARTIKIVALG